MYSCSESRSDQRCDWSRSDRERRAESVERPRPAHGPHLKTSRVLTGVYDRHGFSPEDGYRRLLGLCRPWLTGLRLIDFHGNSGARGYEAAEARHTEVCLTYLGSRVAEGIAGSASALPVGLVLGDLHKGGNRPPIDPHRLVATLRQMAADDGVDPAPLLEEPGFPAGCHVDGEIGQLWLGHAVRLRLTAHVDITGPNELRVRNLPPRFSEAEVAHGIASRSDELHVVNVDDRSTMEDTDIRVKLADFDPHVAIRLLRSIWGVTQTIDCDYGRPIREILLDWIAADIRRIDELDALTG